MTPQQKLHSDRLQKAQSKLKEIRQSNENPTDAEFRSWRERVTQSLTELFGSTGSYTDRFARLKFCVPRATLGEPQWTREDQEQFEVDIEAAEEILSDALEELAVAPPEPASEDNTQDTRPSPSIVLQVTNVLSQTTHVTLENIYQTIDQLPLDPEQRTSAKREAENLSEEMAHNQRWPVLAKSLDALKAMGKSVYENVAIPLLLDMLRRQSGIGS